MSWWWKSLFQKRTLDAQLSSEVRFHIAELTDANIAAGMSPEEARRRAVLEFGGGEQIKEELRDVHRVRIIESSVANLKSAFRFIRKSPSFSAVIIVTLALGIGANSAVFSAIDAILLRPMPFPNGDQLVTIVERNPKINSPRAFVAPIRLEEWNRMNSTFQSISGYYTENVSETSGSLPEKWTRAWVAPRFLQVWGISPALGRDFTPDEETFGGPAGVLISDRLWRQRFGANPNVVGQKLRLDGFAFSVVGVMPASFLFPVREVDLWTPIAPDAPFCQNRNSTWFTAVGRLKPGITLAEARANMDTVQAQLAKAFPKPDADISPVIEPLKEVTVADSRRSLWLLFGAVSLLLLIACTNIVALLLARASQRQHEISVRYSLGASRGAIVAQLLTETMVLAITGAALGLFLARSASKVFRMLASTLPRVEEIRLDWRMVLYALGCSLVVTLLCGLVPALRGTRRNLAGSLAQASRTQVSGRNPLQWLLVGVQVALAVTLLAGAGLLFRSFQALGKVSPGFTTAHILTFHINASWGESGDMKKLTQRIQGIQAALRTVPGVEDAAISAALPGVPNQYQTELKFTEGESDPEHKIIAESRFVSPSYFSTMRIPLLAGEMCHEQPNLNHAMVNRSFANTFLPGSGIIGRHISLLGSTFVQTAEVRGVVADAREAGLNREPGPVVYWCMSAPMPDPSYLVRTAMDPMALAETIRKKVHELEPNRSVFALSPLEAQIDDAFLENRLRTVLLAFFAGTAVALACVGLYGTLSYAVSVRQREVGLRLALGALRGQIVKQFLLQGLVVTVLGCAVGWGLAAAFARFLSGMLYGVSPSDITTLGSVMLMMVAVAALASLIPAIRAARVDPMQVLREE
jgi:putative ABC transport system permease protein